MSTTLARACKVGALALTVGLIALSNQSARGQTFAKRFTPQNPLLNNGSLYTAPNPTWPLPNQAPFMYIAVAHQDCRLYHNGATLMPVNRLLAGQCTDMQPNQVQASNGFIPNYGSTIFAQTNAGGGGGGNNTGTNTGNNQGGNGGVIVLPPQFPFAQQAQLQQAYQYQMYQAYQYQQLRNAAMNANTPSAYDNYRNFAGNGAPLPGAANQSPFFNAVPNNAVGMNAVANPFAAFNVERDAKENKDKAKPDARKDDDALKPEDRKNKDEDR